MKTCLVRRIKKFGPVRVANALYAEGYLMSRPHESVIEYRVGALPRPVIERVCWRLENNR